ncbi:MAG TPA: DUF1294 domain-containing protein [Patescibacteria group bacterium]|nr:DUF1294 domain-containing protein [Patescibacteria group bacterium]
MNSINIIIIILALINLLSFLTITLDKSRSAISGEKRISEGMMFFLAALGGSFGVYIGMFVVRHKTRKWYFLVGIPLMMIQNLTLAYFVYNII